MLYNEQYMYQSKDLTIEKIHKTFVPEYDRWHGKLLPRIKSWFAHIWEVIFLWIKGNKVYSKHGISSGTCREHSAVEFGDWLWLTVEIIWMITGIELKIVPEATYKRVWNKMQENKDKRIT